MENLPLTDPLGVHNPHDPAPLPAARFRVQPRLLEDLLKLPGGVSIVGVAWDPDRRVIVLDVVDHNGGSGLPTDRTSDGRPKLVEPVCRKEQITWDFSREIED